MNEEKNEEEKFSLTEKSLRLFEKLGLLKIKEEFQTLFKRTTVEEEE